jgi:hypothetical protein
MSILPGLNLAGMGTRAAAGGGGNSATVIGTYSASANGTVVWPVGTQAGDVAIVAEFSSSNTSDFTGFTHVHYEVPVGATSWRAHLLFKVLEQSDIDTPPSHANAGSPVVDILVVRQTNTAFAPALLGSIREDTSTSASVSPSAGYNGIVAVALLEDGTFTATPPASMSVEIENNDSPFQNVFFFASAADYGGEAFQITTADRQGYVGVIEL